MLAVAEPPDAAADENEKDKTDGESADDLLLPELERSPQLSQLIAEALHLKLQVCVAGRFVIKMAILFPFATVAELQGATLGLVAGRVGMRGIARKIETFQRRVPGAGLSSEE